MCRHGPLDSGNLTPSEFRQRQKDPTLIHCRLIGLTKMVPRVRHSYESYISHKLKETQPVNKHPQRPI